MITCSRAHFFISSSNFLCFLTTSDYLRHTKTLRNTDGTVEDKVTWQQGTEWTFKALFSVLLLNYREDCLQSRIFYLSVNRDSAWTRGTLTTNPAHPFTIQSWSFLLPVLLRDQATSITIWGQTSLTTLATTIGYLRAPITHVHVG